VKSTDVAKAQFIHFRRLTVLDELPKQWRRTHAVENRTQELADREPFKPGNRQKSSGGFKLWEIALVEGDHDGRRRTKPINLGLGRNFDSEPL